MPEVPVAPLTPDVPAAPIKPPGLTSLGVVIIVDGAAFPVYPVFVKVTEVVPPIVLTEKYPAVSM